MSSTFLPLQKVYTGKLVLAMKSTPLSYLPKTAQLATIWSRETENLFLKDSFPIEYHLTFIQFGIYPLLKEPSKASFPTRHPGMI